LKALGRHLVADFFECSGDLNSPDMIMKALEKACTVSGATIISKTGHHFSPYGVTAVVIIAESHLAIHTWPEFKYAAVDVFTCGTTVDSQAAFLSLKDDFGSDRVELQEIHRGILTDEDLLKVTHGPKPMEVDCGV